MIFLGTNAVHARLVPQSERIFGIVRQLFCLATDFFWEPQTAARVLSRRFDKKPRAFHAMKQSTDTNRLQAQIDENLKKVFQETLNEEVPDRFRDLLEKLRQKEAKP